MTGADPIDRARLAGLAKVMGPSGYQALLDSADTAIADLMGRLATADQTQDTKLFRDAVHGLAGLLANIGMEGLAKAARSLPRPPETAADARAALGQAITDAMSAARLV